MATVYLATDLRHDRPVALKVLKPELAAAVGPERFLREIKTTAHLTHPHVLPPGTGHFDLLRPEVVRHHLGEVVQAARGAGPGE